MSWCLFICTLNSVRSSMALSHSEHLYLNLSFSFCWCCWFKCESRLFLYTNICVQYSHLKGLSKWTTLRCWCMRDFWENVQLQPPSNVHAYRLPLKQFFSCTTRLSDVSNTSLHFTQKISALSSSSFITFFGCFILLVSNLSGSNQVFLVFSLITANSLFTLLLLTDCLAPTLFKKH